MRRGKRSQRDTHFRLQAPTDSKSRTRRHELFTMGSNISLRGREDAEDVAGYCISVQAPLSDQKAFRQRTRRVCSTQFNQDTESAFVLFFCWFLCAYDTLPLYRPKEDCHIKCRLLRTHLFSETRFTPCARALSRRTYMQVPFISLTVSIILAFVPSTFVFLLCSKLCSSKELI